MWDDLKRDFHILENRIKHAPEVGYTALKGFTWDLFIQGKTTSQVARELRAMSEDLDSKASKRWS